MTNTVRVASWNLHHYLQHTAGVINSAEVTGWVATVITSLDADVVLLQGLPSKTDAGHRLDLLTELSDATGSTCDTTANSASPTATVAAIAQSATGCDSGILWDPGFTPVPGSWSSYGRTPAGLRHSMAVVTLTGDFGDLRVASFFADPVDPDSRVADASVVRDVLAQNTDIPTLIGGGWNSLSADCDADADPYANTGANSTLVWREHFEHQVRITTFEAGAPASWKGDRRPAQTLADGGLRDPAVRFRGDGTLAATGTPGDRHPLQRVDRILANTAAATRVVEYHVHDTDDARLVALHLPISLVLEWGG